MEDLVQDIGNILKQINKLACEAEKQYTIEVEDILQTEDRDRRRIERLLDYMLDFCFDAIVLGLFKKLCRYYYRIDPEATVSYVNSYREMWDEQVGV